MAKSAGKVIQAKRWFIRGCVQGVGYSYFAQRAAGPAGYSRNLDDGRAAVYAAGPATKLSELAGMLFCGPRRGEVDGTEEQEAGVHKYGSCRIA